MQAVIVAGGWGSRLESLAGETAPVLLPVAGRPFIDYLLAHLVSEGIDDVILLLDRHAEQVEQHVGVGERHHVRIRTMRDGDFPLDVLGSVKQVEDWLDNTFCLVRGNTYPRVDLQTAYATFLGRLEPALMVVHANHDPRYANDADLRGDSVGRFDAIEPGPHHEYRFAGITMIRSMVIDEMRPASPIGEQAFYGGLTTDARLAAYVAGTPSYEITTPETLAHFTEAVARSEVRI